MLTSGKVLSLLKEMKDKKDYGTLSVHLPAEVIARVDEVCRAEDRSRSRVLGRIITRELATAPEPRIRFARRPQIKAKAEVQS